MGHVQGVLATQNGLPAAFMAQINSSTTPSHQPHKVLFSCLGRPDLELVPTVGFVFPIPQGAAIIHYSSLYLKQHKLTNVCEQP